MAALEMLHGVYPDCPTGRAEGLSMTWNDRRLTNQSSGFRDVIFF
jgi:hypothetical protein